MPCSSVWYAKRAGAESKTVTCKGSTAAGLLDAPEEEDGPVVAYAVYRWYSMVEPALEKTWSSRCGRVPGSVALFIGAWAASGSRIPRAAMAAMRACRKPNHGSVMPANVHVTRRMAEAGKRT